MNGKNFEVATQKIIELIKISEQETCGRLINDDVAESYGHLLLTYAQELITAANENEPQISETSRDCVDKDNGIAHACIRTAQIKSIDFSVDGVTTINMRHGEPIIFKDISEVMFIS